LIKSKILVIHGDQDKVVPIDNAYLIKEALNDLVTLKILNKKNHQNIQNSQINKLITQWFIEEGI